MKDLVPYPNFVFDFEGYQVCILASVPRYIYLILCAYSRCSSDDDKLDKFVRLVAIELHYPIQVLPVLEDFEFGDEK